MNDIPSSAPLFLDTSVLINFLCVHRLDLVNGAWVDLRIVEEVRGEITDQNQRSILEAAIHTNVIHEFRVENLDDIALIAELHDAHGLGWGESASLAGAARLQAWLAMDDKQAIKSANDLLPQLPIITTKGLVVLAIRKSLLTANEAVELQVVWAREHRFHIPGHPEQWLLEP